MPNKSFMTFTEGSGVAESLFGRSQAPIRLFLEKNAEAFEQQSLIDTLFAPMNSTHGVEGVSSKGGMGNFLPVGENGAYPQTGFEMGFEKFLKAETWKSQFSVSWEATDDATLINFTPEALGFIDGYHRAREEFRAALYGAALNAQKDVKINGQVFDATTADGVTLFNSAHPAAGRGGRKQSNVCSDEFSADALDRVEEKMQLVEDDSGHIMAITPDTILIPAGVPGLKRKVFEIIGADKDPATANNAFNYQFGRWTVISDPYLAKHVKDGAAPWIMLDSRYLKARKAALWLERKKLNVKSYIDQNTDANVWAGKARFTAGFVDWRFAFAGGVSGADSLIA